MEKIVGGAELKLAYPNGGSIAGEALESKATEASAFGGPFTPNACG
jgi:hypothetical protein